MIQPSIAPTCKSIFGKLFTPDTLDTLKLSWLDRGITKKNLIWVTFSTSLDRAASTNFLQNINFAGCDPAIVHWINIAVPVLECLEDRDKYTASNPPWLNLRGRSHSPIGHSSTTGASGEKSNHLLVPFRSRRCP